MEPRIIRFEWSKYLKNSTIIGGFVLLLVLSRLAVNIFENFFNHEQLPTPLVIVFVFCAFVIVEILRYSPRYLLVDAQGITIYTRLSHCKIDYREIKTMTAIPPEALKRSWRMVASADMGGEIGWFSNKTLGRHFRYVTQRKDLLLLETHQGRKYVISCPQREWLLHFAQEKWRIPTNE